MTVLSKQGNNMNTRYIVDGPDFEKTFDWRVYELKAINHNMSVGECIGRFDTNEYAQAYALDMQMVADWEAAQVQLDVGCEFDFDFVAA